METDVASSPPPKPTVNSYSQTQNLSSSSSPLPPSVLRQWRQHAQRNMRNQWSKFASYRQQWASFTSSGRSHATSLVNAYLNLRYIPSMELGILHDMPAIQAKASQKIFKQQELHQSKLLTTYKDMVGVVTHMVNAARSMRSFLRGASSSLIMQFSSSSDDMNDNGDGGGIPVFAFLSISSLGEFKDLIICNLYSKETCEPLFPKLNGSKSSIPAVRCTSQPNDQTLQSYITTWLAEVNLDAHRVDEIFAMVGEEMNVGIS
ncbi:uncharacterized protein LOC119997456 isoform X2 [Tripterygium wilfordii]|uniref:uncharacterized protein LOC119997456 isoform X2 n=1 Tax=Tripterygium wilfordii TaxID=458696 RepID=UPI0018F823B1|nr:uncharacterized protein LOC119997456 isoform X2 [Tripterygium wilfordii]